MKQSLSICILLGMMFSFNNSSLAHGVRGVIEMGKGSLLDISYDDGSPFSYSEVSIFYQNETVPFQTGFTDKNGHFMFMPDNQGEWKAVVNDGLGHKLTLKLTVNDNHIVESTGEKVHSASEKTIRALAGVSVLFFLTGLILWQRASTKRQNIEPTRCR